MVVAVPFRQTVEIAFDGMVLFDAVAGEMQPNFTNSQKSMYIQSYNWLQPVKSLKQLILLCFFMHKSQKMSIQTNFFCNYAKRFRSLFVPLHPISHEASKTVKRILYGMNLNMHITSQSFVQSYRCFEQNCYVHTFSTSEHISGIGFPRYSEHSYFCQAS